MLDLLLGHYNKIIAYSVTLLLIILLLFKQEKLVLSYLCFKFMFYTMVLKLRG